MSREDIQHVLALPREEIGTALIERTEDQWFDRKSGRISPRDLADCAIGFANAEGGVVVVGLWQGRVQGIDGQPPHLLNAWRQAAFDFSEPTVPVQCREVPCLNERGAPDHVFVVEIGASTQVHANRRDEVFLRVGDETRKLTFSQRQELLYEKGQSSFETTIVPDAGLDDCDAGLLDEYGQATGHPSPRRLLQARGLLTTDGRLTVAAALLFLEYPQRFHPEALVRILRYQGVRRGTGARQQLVEDIRCEGPVPRILERAREVLTDLVPSRRTLASHGRFEQASIVPMDALFEGVVNAVVHRSYSIVGDHVRVDIFDDRVEIESPGRFPGLADISKPLSIPRYARNPRIARACAELRYGQELGEGIRRMFEETHMAGLVDPDYSQTSGSVRLVLSSMPADHELEGQLAPSGLTLLRHLRLAGPAKTGDLVRDTGLTRPTVVRHLRALERAGLVEWVGQSSKDPTAFWRPSRR